MAHRETITLAPGNECPTCGTNFEGKFCYKCGEKQVDLKDYSIKKYLEQAVDIFTHFDGKFFLSVKYLLFYPGKLPVEYLCGRRIKLMKPLQLYLIFNVVFFLLLYKSADMFNVDFNYIDDNPYGEQAMALAKQKISKSAISYKTFAGLYDDKAAAYGKLFLPAFIPLMGLVSYLLFFKRIKQFVPHLVFSTHLFTFIIFLFLLFICGVAKPLYSTQFFNEYRSFLWKIVFMIIGVYMAFANKTVYKESWLLTIPKSIVMMIAFVFILAAYRTAITFITLYKM